MRNRVIVLIIAASVAAIGVSIAYNTPVDAIPDLSENQVIVFADWMGRSPKEIEEQVTYPLSVNLQGLAGVKAVRSSSEFNFSMINVIFDDSIEFYFARQRVLERLGTVNTLLPAGVVPYMAPDATALGQIFWYTVEGDGYDLAKLRSIQDWYVRYQLNSVSGVAQVATVGGAAREYQIDVDPQKLRAYGITLGEIVSAVSRSNSAVGGKIVHKGNAEYLIRSVGWIRSITDIEQTVVATRDQVPIYVKNVAIVQLGPDFKRAILEKDGNEAVGGVVMMRFGENPLEVTRNVKEKIRALQAGLPKGVRIEPFYERTALIQRAIHTLTETLTEELIVTSLVVILIMGHFGAALTVCIVLPLAVLAALIFMHYFQISSNIMSLSGIAISIGIIVDQAIVMVDNVMHNLQLKFKDQPVTGDNTEYLIPHCQSVGRPIFFSVTIMVVSFLPVFALSGMEGKMFHPLAFTKVFALLAVAILSISLVPALANWFIRGRVYAENESWLVRQVANVYKPLLWLLMNRPKLVIWLFVVILSLGGLFAGRLGREFMPTLDEGSSLEMPITVPRVSITEVADDIRVRDAIIRQLPEVELVVGKAGRADTPTDPSPLDMIETVINYHPNEHWHKRMFKRADAETQAERAVNAFMRLGVLSATATPELQQKIGKDIAMEQIDRFDAAMRVVAVQRRLEYNPILGEKLLVKFQGELLNHAKALGAIKQATSTFILPQNIRSEFSPLLAKGISIEQFDRLFQEMKRQLVQRKIIADNSDLRAESQGILNSIFEAICTLFGKHRFDVVESLWELLKQERLSLLSQRTELVNNDLFHTAASIWTSLAMEAIISKARNKGILLRNLSEIEKHTLEKELTETFKSEVFLWKKTKTDLVGELDQMLTMPGWGNIWTQPIINRIDMLSTGVRTMIGVKVFGNDILKIQEISEQIAAVLKQVSGAADVFADQIIGKGYLEIEIDRKKAAKYGISIGDIQDTIEIALGGKTITTTVEARERYPVRIRYARDYREDEEKIRRLLVGGSLSMGEAIGTEMGETAENTSVQSPGATRAIAPLQIPLAEVARVNVVEGPAMIKSENGMLRSYVQLNVRDRDIVGFVEEAQRLIAAKITLPPGMYIEWSGQFEHQIRARRTLTIVFPIVILIIFIILYLTYHDLADAILMMMAVPGAVAGGVLFQYLFGFNFSVAVWVGYIACFGMATETGIIMLVYLRMAIEEKGGLEKIKSLNELREVIIVGAVHRLRPKLLTEGTMIIGLAPMLWATGTGAEIMRPMAAPVLGGILIADEVIDLFLPVLFYWIRKQRWLSLNKAASSVEDSTMDS